MSQISVSQFHQIALPIDGDSKIRVDGDSLRTTSSHDTLGGRFVSWIKLHTTGDAQKLAAQNSFKTALTAGYGKELGEAAYAAFAPKDGRTHSLTKAQVLSSLEFADRKVETTLAHLKETVAKSYGKEIAKEVGAQLRSNTLLKGTVIAAKGSTDLSALEAQADTIAKNINKDRIADIEQDLSDRIESLKDAGALESIAEVHGIQVKWDTIKPEMRDLLINHLKDKLSQQTYPTGGKVHERSYLSNESVETAAVNQLKVLAECQDCLPGGSRFNDVLKQAGLTADDVSASHIEKLAVDLLRESQPLISQLGETAGLEKLQNQLQKTILMSAVFNTVKQSTREALNTPEFAQQFTAYLPDGHDHLEAFASKWLPDLATNDVIEQLSKGAEFTPEHTILDAANAQLRKEFELAEVSHGAVKALVANLSDEALDGAAFALQIKQFTKGNATLSQDNLSDSIQLHLERLHKQDPDGYARFAEAFQSGQLKENLAALGAGTQQLQKETETALYAKASAEGKPLANVQAESAQLVAAATGAFISFFGPLLETMRPDASDQNTIDAQINEHIGAYLNGQAPEDVASKIASGFVEAFKDQYDAAGISLSFS